MQIRPEKVELPTWKLETSFNVCFFFRIYLKKFVNLAVFYEMSFFFFNLICLYFLTLLKLGANRVPNEAIFLHPFFHIISHTHDSYIQKWYIKIQNSFLWRIGLIASGKVAGIYEAYTKEKNKADFKNHFLLLNIDLKMQWFQKIQEKAKYLC